MKNAHVSRLLLSAGLIGLPGCLEEAIDDNTTTATKAESLKIAASADDPKFSGKSIPFEVEIRTAKSEDLSPNGSRPNLRNPGTDDKIEVRFTFNQGTRTGFYRLNNSANNFRPGATERFTITTTRRDIGWLNSSMEKPTIHAVELRISGGTDGFSFSDVRVREKGQGSFPFKWEQLWLAPNSSVRPTLDTNCDPSRLGFSCGESVLLTEDGVQFAEGTLNGSCAPHHVDLNGLTADGCEINSDTDRNHCGQELVDCSRPRWDTQCIAGQCFADECAKGYHYEGLDCVDTNECLTNNGGCSAQASCTNTEGSRICTCWPGLVGDGKTCMSEYLDTDGDGLPDAWEIYGHGTSNWQLSADPNKKDLFVECDYMKGFKPSEAAMNMVVESFAKAPVRNPDGSSGINLHIHIDDEVPTDSNLSPVWDEFYAIKSDYFDSAARGRVYRYCIFGDRYDGTRSGGMALVHGEDFVVTLGTFDATKSLQAAVFMHELGHNLGLRHGGGDAMNYKPNYLSIMNYAFNLSGLRTKTNSHLIDYSRFSLADLDESALRESDGLNLVGGGSESVLSTYQLAYFSPQKKLIYDSDASKNIDWNRSGSVSGKVTADVNGDGGISVLKSQNDWDRLSYAGSKLGPFGSKAQDEEVVCSDFP